MTPALKRPILSSAGGQVPVSLRRPLTNGVPSKTPSHLVRRTINAETNDGFGEEAAFIDIDADANGQATCGVYNEALGLAVALRFPKAQLPWLTNWQHWGKGEYVTGLEPGTHPPIGQAAARAQHTLIELAPGEKRSYTLEIEIITDSAALRNFVGKP